MNAELLHALISRLIINIGYIFFTLLFIRIMEGFISNKNDNAGDNGQIGENAHRINVIAGLTAMLYPIFIYVIIIFIGTLNSGLNDVWIVNNLAWSHTVIPLVLAVVFVPLIGIGKWNWQLPVQIFLLSIIFHFLFDIILLQIPLYFLYPIYTYDVLEYGFNLIARMDVFLGNYIGEIIISAIFIAFYFLQGRKSANNS